MTVLPRRRFLRGAGAAAALPLLGPATLLTAPGAAVAKTIPRSGEPLAAIGMGSWRTFDVRTARAINQRVDVLRAFFGAGGGIIDSSPMYGRSEAVIGQVLSRLGATPGLFSATKVWTVVRQLGIDQMRHSAGL